jgi:hypothetical protein
MGEAHLVQILLPLTDNDGRAFEHALYSAIAQEMTDRFGGVTVYSRGPAEGFWDGGERRDRDDILVMEVMTGTLDAAWWGRKREAWEREFRQDEVVVRAWPIRRL